MTNTVTISVEAYNKLVNERNTYKESWAATKDALKDNANREAMEDVVYTLAYDTIDRLNRQYIELEDHYAVVIDKLNRNLADARAKNDVLKSALELCINSDWAL